jgi:hypothetical protein
MGHGGMLGAPTADAPPPGSPEADASERLAGGGHHGPDPYRGDVDEDPYRDLEERK